MPSRFRITFTPVRGRSFTKTVSAVDGMQAVRKASLKVPKSKLPMSNIAVKEVP